MRLEAVGFAYISNVFLSSQVNVDELDDGEEDTNSTS